MSYPFLYVHNIHSPIQPLKEFCPRFAYYPTYCIPLKFLGECNHSLWFLFRPVQLGGVSRNCLSYKMLTSCFGRVFFLINFLISFNVIIGSVRLKYKRLYLLLLLMRINIKSFVTIECFAGKLVAFNIRKQFNCDVIYHFCLHIHFEQSYF